MEAIAINACIADLVLCLQQVAHVNCVAPVASDAYNLMQINAHLAIKAIILSNRLHNREQAMDTVLALLAQLAAYYAMVLQIVMHAKVGLH